MFLYKVDHQDQMDLPGGVISQLPVIVMIHQSVHHPPGGGVGPPEEQHPEGGDAGEEGTVGLVVGDLHLLPGRGQHLALQAVPPPSLATSFRDRIFLNFF